MGGTLETFEGIPRAVNFTSSSINSVFCNFRNKFSGLLRVFGELSVKGWCFPLNGVG